MRRARLQRGYSRTKESVAFIGASGSGTKDERPETSTERQMLRSDSAFGILLLNVSILGVFPLPCEPGKLGEPLGFRIARSRADDSPDVFFVVDQRPD